jgi:hypothetical protein
MPGLKPRPTVPETPANQLLVGFYAAAVQVLQGA